MRKRYFVNLVIIFFGLSLLILFVIQFGILSEPRAIASTPTTHYEKDSSHFHLVAIGEERKTVQAWQFLPDTQEWLKLNEFTIGIDKPEKIIFPPEEIEQMELFLKAENIITPANELTPIAYITKATVSPTGNIMVVVEIDRYQFEGFFYNSYGTWRVTRIDLETGNAQVLLQLPLQWGEATVDNLLWSSNGRFLGLTRYFKNEDNTLIIVDMNSNQYQEISNNIDLYGPLNWSSESNVIISYLSRWHIQSQGGIIFLCNIDDIQCRDIQLEGLWVHQSRFSNVDWSPDGNLLVFSASDADPSLMTDLSPKLYLLNLDSEIVSPIELDLENVFAHPRWSPDGRFIAADYSEQVLDHSRTVVIIDPISKQIINQLPLPTGWVWGPDSRTIWRLSGQYPDKLMMTDIFDSSSQSITIPDELMGSRIEFNIIDN